MRKEYQKSFTLLETIVAIYVLLTGIVGVMSLSQQNLQAASVFRSQLIAANLAQEGMEMVRNQRDYNVLQCENGLGSPSCGAEGFLQPNLNNLGTMESCLSAAGCTVYRPEVSSGSGISFSECTASTCTPTCPGGNCLFLQQNPVTGEYGYDSGWKNTPFVRSIKIREVGAYSRPLPEATSASVSDWEVTSKVEWNDRFVNRKVELKAYLAPWGH